MSQRATQTSVVEFLSANAEDLHPRTVEQYKHRTAADLGTEVFLGPNRYHQDRGGIPGCPNADWELADGTIEDAIEKELDPCKGCHPIDYRVVESHPASDEETAILLPEQRPTSPSDLGWITHTRGNTRRTAHLAATGGDEPEPLCVCTGVYCGGDNWACKSESVYPNADDWFELCEYCLEEYDRVRRELR